MKSGLIASALAAGLAAAPALTLAAANDASPWTISGSVGLSSDYRERGVSQSTSDPSAHVSVEVAHRAGAYASLGVASVSDTEYTGGAGVELTPAFGWRFTPADDWGIDLGFNGNVYPGASGAREAQLADLPPAVANRIRAASADQTFDTVQASAALSYRGLEFRASHALTDYFGARYDTSTHMGQVQNKAVDSKGTTYLELNYDHPIGQHWQWSAHVGRLHVPNLDALDYTDWQLGASVDAWGLTWSLAYSATNAQTVMYRVAHGSREVDLSSDAVLASVNWKF